MPVKLQSINNVYKAGIIIKGGKNVPYIYKSAECKKMCSLITDSLRAVDFSQHLEWIKNTKWFDITQNYVLKDGIRRRDTENFAKPITDTIVRYFNEELGLTDFDDSQILSEFLYKSYLPGSQNEYICIELRPSTFNPRFDQIQKPEIMKIHSDTWKPKKSELEPYGVREILKKDKGNYDTDIWFLENSDPKKIIEVLENCDFRKQGGFSYIGVLCDGIDIWIDKFNSYGSNIKAKRIEKEADILELFEKKKEGN